MNTFKFMKNINNRSIFSQNLIRLRKEKGLSQLQLSELTGLTRDKIAQYETRNINPPLKNLELLASSLKVSINDLIGHNKLQKNDNIFCDLDTRTLQKFKQLLALKQLDRHVVYSLIDSLYKKTTKNKKGKQNALS